MGSNITEFIEICRQDGQAVERLITSYYCSRPSFASFVDGGCHLGYHTFKAATHFQGKVLSIDANQSTYQKFTDQLLGHSADFQNRIIPIFGALQSDPKAETVSFFCSSSHPGRSSINTRPWGQWGQGSVVYEKPLTVSALTIDGLCNRYEIKDVGFIKLDLESGEFPALKGAKATLQDNRPHIAMEYGLKLNNQDLMGYSQRDFFDFMKNLGYVILSPWGEELNVDQSYQFWYAFGIPVEELEDSKKKLKDIFLSNSWSKN
jgi:FkbM family methyltransferase